MDSVRSLNSGFIKRAAEGVINHIGDVGFSGNELADQLALSREQTHRKLKQYTSLSTGKFIRYIRLLKSCIYLNENKFSIAEISYKVGFDSPSYFNKCFKDEMGISPGEFKKKKDTAQLGEKPIFTFYQCPEIYKVLSSNGIHLALTIQKKRKNARQKVLWIASIPIILLVIITSFLLSIKGKEKAVATLVEKSRIAVIPFANQTGDSLMTQVGDITSSWISSQLDELEDVKTVPYFTIKQYQPHIGILPNDPQNRPTLGEVVGAQYFITGNYFLKGRQIYFDTRLIDAYSQETIYHLPVMEGPKDSVMQVIENLRLKIAGLVTNLEEVKLGKLTPPNYEAYKNYFSGLQELGLGISPDALQYFEKATALEPDFLMPQVFLTWFYRGQKRDSVLQLMGKISNITEYERNVYLELYYTYERNYREALNVTLRSLEDYPQDYYFNIEAAHLAKTQFMPHLALKILSELQDPLHSDVGLVWHYFKVWNYTEALVMIGRYEEALTHLQAIPIEFHTPAIPGLFLYVYAKLEKPKEEAETLIERFAKNDKKLFAEYYTAAAYEFGIVDESETSLYFAKKAVSFMQTIPGKGVRYYDLADALYLSDNLKEAKIYLEQRLEENPHFAKEEKPLNVNYYTNDDYLIYLANVEAALGHAAEAEQIFTSLENQSQMFWRRHGYEYRIDYLKARVYAQLGRKKEAVALLKSALTQGQLHHHWDFENDIFLKPLFDYPPFQALVSPKDDADITIIP